MSEKTHDCSAHCWRIPARKDMTFFYWCFQCGSFGHDNTPDQTVRWYSPTGIGGPDPVPGLSVYSKRRKL